MRKSEEEHSTKLVHAMTSILLGGAIALAVCFAFLLLCSIGISAGFLSERLMNQLTVVGCVLGSFFGGLSAVGRCRSRTLLVGLGCGLVFFLLLLTAGVLLFERVSLLEGGAGLLCGALCGGAVAGIAGGKPRKKRRK